MRTAAFSDVAIDGVYQTNHRSEEHTMSIIARIELYHVAIPLPATFYPSWIPGFPRTENRFTLIKVITDDGVEGYSAVPPWAGSGPALENSWDRT